MANNHMGDVNHAKKIIKEFSILASKNKISAGIKLQFRELDSFLHPDFKSRNDLKFVKRFNETRLNEAQFKEIVEEIKNSGLDSIVTPFDNESISLTKKLDIDILKIASCSIDDWVLLDEVCKEKKKIIISTAGADISTIRKVYELFKKNRRDFSFLHCVGEYPTQVENSNLNKINILKEEFPDVEIGISTHESPLNNTITPYAVAMGCKIIEKHIGVKTKEFELNKYSLEPSQMQKVIDEVFSIESILNGKSLLEKDTLKTLKRGIYFKSHLKKGHVIRIKDLFFAMPVQDGQSDVSEIDLFLGTKLNLDVSKNSIVRKSDVVSNTTKVINSLINTYKDLIKKYDIYLNSQDEIELSCHYGINDFHNHGAMIVSKVNREYCKKLIIMLPNQYHPNHRHIIKEETFELLKGDCILTLNGKEVSLVKGKPVIISRKVEHSFFSKKGCVVEEISTTHHKGDSIYNDPKINKLDLKERKIRINLL